MNNQEVYGLKPVASDNAESGSAVTVNAIHPSAANDRSARFTEIQKYNPRHVLLWPCKATRF